MQAMFNPANRRDYLFITILVVLAGIPLLESRLQQPPSLNSPLLMVCFLLFLVAAWVWLHGSLPAARKSHMVRVDAGHTLLIAALFLGFTIVAFYLPMRLRYWVGIDETLAFRLGFEGPWTLYFDQIGARPLLSMPFYVSFGLSESLHGFLWLAAAARLLTALLIYRVVSDMRLTLSAIGAIAGILYLVNPSELARFAPMYAVTNILVCLLWLSLWIFLRSYQYQRRGWLILSLVLLGVALLSYEVTFMHVPLFLAILLMPYKPQRWVWLFALGTATAVIVLRYAIHFLSGGGYQVGISTFGPQSLLFVDYLRPALSYFVSPPPQYWLYGILPGLLAVILMMWLVSPAPLRSVKPSQLGVLLGIAAIGILLGVLPFTFFSAFFGLIRTQFYAAPMQALLLAALLGLLLLRLRHSMQRTIMVAISGLLVAFSVAQAYFFQEQITLVNPPASLTTIKRTLTNADAVLPPPRQDTFYFFVQGQEDSSPFAAYQELTYLSCMVWGVPAYQGEYTPTGLLVNLYGVPNYGRDWAQSRLFADPSLKVIFLSISAQGDVELLNLPTPDLTPPDDVKIPDILVRSTAERCTPMRDVHINDPLRFLQVSP